MYLLLGLDTVLRIAAALLILFVAVPALAMRRPRALDWLEWFWWCFAAGIVFLTLLGQLATLLNIASAPTLLLALAALVVLVRAKTRGTTPIAILRDAYRFLVLASLNVVEGRVNLPRRARRAYRSTRRFFAKVFATRTARWAAAGWFVVVAAAIITRFYRPFATANLGFSDTYVHLYLMRLLEQGRQVDPAWGPYPRGMHFLLLAIEQLTNVDAILLMNFFGAAAGVLITIAVADAARRLSKSLAAGLLAGVIFATMIGGAHQYFMFGGSIATPDGVEGASFVRMPYEAVPPTTGEFDVLLTVFQRQTATLPQELALVLLLPAIWFLLRMLRDRESVGAAGLAPPRDDGGASPAAPTDPRWAQSGFFFSTAAIAAIHPGVVVPLVLLSAIAVLAMRTRHILRPALTGAAGIALGSTWMLAFIAYPYIGAQTKEVASGSGVGTTALFYFPLLRGIAGIEEARIRTWVAITPFLLIVVAAAIVLLALAIRRKDSLLAFTSLATIIFFITHIASRAGLPEIVEVRRNASWFAMIVAILLATCAGELVRAIARASQLVSQLRLRPAYGAVVVLLALWAWRVPVVSASGLRDKLINYSGYGATAYAVLSIQRTIEPFSWTLVTYGQEYPMVLGRGFHLSAAAFLDQYDPAAARLDIPTKYVFIAVEKNPHHFQINSWSERFTRVDLEQRLQTWCFLYQLNHRNIRVFQDDENVRVYVIERSDKEVRQIADGGRG